jgi:hypothetical protein
MHLNIKETNKLLKFIIESKKAILSTTDCENSGFILDDTFFSHFYDLLDQGFLIQQPSGGFRISPDGRKKYAVLDPSAMGLMFDD